MGKKGRRGGGCRWAGSGSGGRGLSAGRGGQPVGVRAGQGRHSHAVQDEAQEHEHIVALVVFHIAYQPLAQLAQVAGSREAVLVHEGAPGPDGRAAPLQPLSAYARGNQLGQQGPGGQSRVSGGLGWEPRPSGNKGEGGMGSGVLMGKGPRREQDSWIPGDETAKGPDSRVPRALCLEAGTSGTRGGGGGGRIPASWIRGYTSAGSLTWRSALLPRHPSAGPSGLPCLRCEGQNCW
jgi:hypothetical protein